MGTKGLQRFMAPIPEAIFFDILAICAFQDKCLSTRTPTDFVVETCLIGKLSRTRLGDLSKVPNFCYDPITMNSVLVLLRVNLLAFSQSLTLARSRFKVHSMSSMLLLAYVKCVSSAYISGSELTRQFGKSFM